MPSIANYIHGAGEDSGARERLRGALKSHTEYSSLDSVSHRMLSNDRKDNCTQKQERRDLRTWAVFRLLKILHKQSSLSDTACRVLSPWLPSEMVCIITLTPKLAVFCKMKACLVHVQDRISSKVHYQAAYFSQKVLTTCNCISEYSDKTCLLSIATAFL